MNESVKKALKLILGKEIDTEEEALRQLNEFLNEKGLPDLGITDLKILIETAVNFSNLPKLEILTPEFKKSFNPKQSYYDLVEKEVAHYEERFLSPNGKMNNHVILSLEKTLLRPKKLAKDQKFFKPLIEFVNKNPDLILRFLLRGVSIHSRATGSPIVNFDNVFEFQKEIIGTLFFYQTYSTEQLKQTLPFELYEYKAFATESDKRKVERVTLKPCNLPDLIKIIEALTV